MTLRSAANSSTMSLSSVYEDAAISARELAQSVRVMSTPAPDSHEFLRAFQRKESTTVDNADRLETYLHKMQNFEAPHYEDVFLEPSQNALLAATFKRLDRVQSLVGHGNFNVIGFDEMLRYARRYARVGPFPRQETDFLEEIFSDNARRYGFYGEKVTTELTASVAPNDRRKMRHTGHFLYRGAPEDLYRKGKRGPGREHRSDIGYSQRGQADASVPRQGDPVKGQSFLCFA